MPPNTFAKLPVHALINKSKKKLQASPRAHDPFFDEPKIWPYFIFLKFAPPNTFAKLPVCALINVLKNWPKKINCMLMETFDSMTYFLKVSQEPVKCKNDCDAWQIQLLTVS